MSIQLFEDVFTLDEINDLIGFYDSLPASNTKYLPDGRLWRIMKNSEYNLEDQLPFKIINPKLAQILGAHHFTGGHWMDSYSPFTLHVDTIASYTDRDIPVYESDLHKNIGVLIPLSEHEHFQTIFFDHSLRSFADQDLDSIAQSDSPDLSAEFMQLVDHHDAACYEKIKKLKLDQVVNWKLGSVFCWPRDRLHCSSNFEKYNLHKQAVVLWL